MRTTTELTPTTAAAPAAQPFFEQLWHDQISFVQVVEQAEAWQAQGQAASATALYLLWLERFAERPASQFAWFNLGVLRYGQQQFAAAVQAQQAALAINADLHQARYNLGLCHERLGQRTEAIAQWRQLLQALPAQQASSQSAEDTQLYTELETSTLNSLGHLLESGKNYGEALDCYNRSLAINPLQTDVLHHWIFVRARQCLWPVYEAPEGVDEQVMRNSTSALAQLALYDDPATQLQRARNYAEQKAPAVYPALAQANGYGHKKLRIAYCSSDFCTHPVAMLTVELIERHNREQFEVYGFCWSPDDESPLRQRIVQAFDHYIPVHHLDEAATAQLIRQHEIDILIDLQGQTSGARMQAMALRPAPVQITYLGLPATTGMPTMDFVIGDHYLIPEENAQHYSEQVIYMPDVYQSSDSQRQHNAPLTKKAYGLPGRKLIFCSFNNNYKYTPEVFGAWMRILQRVPNSVLWLLSDNPWSEANLKTQAEQQGIDPARLIFTQRCEPADYLAKYLCADLFLDTFPFNAGTTANDALWMGLPVLTMSGQSFASRMAGALLTAAGLPELITTDLQAYEDLAVQLAEDKAALKTLKQKLAKAKTESPLFDMQRFTTHLEEHLHQIWAQAESGELPWQQEAAQRQQQAPAEPAAAGGIRRLQIGDLAALQNQPSPNSRLNETSRLSEVEAPPQATPSKQLKKQVQKCHAVLDIVRLAEKLQAENKPHEAILAYELWLKTHLQKDTWIARVNLAVLQRDHGLKTQSDANFAIARRMNPGFFEG